MAWWHAVPEDPPRKSRGVQDKPVRKSRLQIRQDTDETFTPAFPEFPGELRHIVDALFEAGPVSVAGTGSTVLTWADLKAWRAGTGIELRPWELRIVRRLSADYLSESHKAESRLAACPFAPDEAQVAQIAELMRDAFRALAQNE